MKSSLLSVLPKSLLLGLALVSGAAASERRFVYNYEPTTAPKGLLELEQWFTFKD